MAEGCSTTGTRPPAERLRRKILALLPEMEEPLVVDFGGVERASSSFLDELLGRLADHLGPEDFARRLEVKGMNQALRSMANVVIRQRLEGAPKAHAGADEALTTV